MAWVKKSRCVVGMKHGRVIGRNGKTLLIVRIFFHKFGFLFHLGKFNPLNLRLFNLFNCGTKFVAIIVAIKLGYTL